MTNELENTLIDACYDARLDCLTELAESGNAEAMYELAFMLHRACEDDDENTKAKAYSWFVKASEAGWANAMFYIGFYYEDILGFGVVEHNVEKALAYYEKAIQMGSEVAMYEMGWRYLLGFNTFELNIPQNIPEGLQLLENAANAMHYRACERLFKHYRYTEKNYEKAMQYADQTISILRDLAIEI